MSETWPDNFSKWESFQTVSLLCAFIKNENNYLYILSQSFSGTFLKPYWLFVSYFFIFILILKEK